MEPVLDTPKKKKNKPSRELLNASRQSGRAIVDYQMIQPNDRILVAVSGGKDSISLLHILRERQRVIPFPFEFIAVHVDFEFDDFDPQPLIAYLERENFPYLVKKCKALEGEKYEEIDCFRWSRQRRRILFELCESDGFNKIALGHHLDDIVETILLNQFYRGEVGAMKPKQELFDGKITIIRPLAYMREESMRILATKLNIESIGGQSKCANDDTSHRMIIKKMLCDFEHHNPKIVNNIFASLQNIRKDYLLDKP